MPGHRSHRLFVRHELTLLRQRVAELLETNAALQTENQVLRQRIEDLEQQAAAQQQVYDDLSQQFDLLRMCFDHAPIGLALASKELGVLQSNPALQAMLGMLPGDWQSMPLQPMLQTEDLLQELAMVDDLDADTHDPIQLEKRHLRKDGKSIWTRIRSTLVQPADASSTVRMISVENITEERQVAAVLHESLLLLQRIFDYAPVSIFVKDTQGHFLLVNQRTAALLGQTPDQLLGQLTYDLFPPDTAAILRTHDQQVLSTGQPMEFEEILNLKEGTTICHCVKFPIYNAQGEIYAIGGIASDITEHKRAGEALRESEEKYRTLFDAVPVGLYRATPEGQFLDVNLAAVDMLGYPSREALLAENMLTLYINHEDRQLRQALLDQAGVARNVELRFRRCDGSIIWILDNVRGLRSAEGQVISYEGSLEDITERKQTEQSIRQSEQKYRLLFDTVSVGLYRSTPAGVFLDVNPTIVKLLGYPDRATLLAQPIVGLYLYPNDRRTWESLLEQEDVVRNYETQLRRYDGSIIWIVENAHVVRDTEGYILAYEGTVEDITERKTYAAEIERLAFTDPLTGLANRRRLYDLGDIALAKSRGNQKYPVLLFLDLDRFKTVNDTLGHDAGDELLRQVAHELRSCIRADDLLARLGGDEFAVLLHHSDIKQALTVADHILERLDRPFLLNEHVVYLGGSIGIAIANTDYLQFSILLTQADIAMYRAKAAGGGVEVYDPTLNPIGQDQIQLESELRLALATNELTLYYQPICDINTEQVVGIEALLRWPHPEQGLLFPDAFLPLAEEIGLMKELDRWVLETALAQIRDWNSSFPGLYIAINLSASSLRDPNLVTDVARLLSTTKVSAEHVILELTEYTALRDQTMTQQTLTELKRLGVRIALDNFGSGYASLTSLQQLPVDILKINRTFMSGIGLAPRDESVVRALLTLGEGLALTVVVEGVERTEQLNWLRNIGCHQVQGYLTGQPVPAEHISLFQVGE